MDKVDKAGIRWLFKEMRKQRVFVYRANGMEIQLSQTAFEPKPPRVPRGAKRRPDAIPAEVAAPFAAFRPPWQQAHDSQEAVEPRTYHDPTDPDAPVDEAVLFGMTIPEN